MLELLIQDGWEDWRELARQAIRRDLPPASLQWRDGRDAQATLFGAMSDGDGPSDTRSALRERPVQRPRPPVPRTFITKAATAAHHSDPQRWELLYRVLWRLTHGEKHLLEVQTDPLVDRMRDLRKAVRRDAHKMKAFVRFRRVDTTAKQESGRERYVAWHRPDHYIVPYVAPFFADRFKAMDWAILTPHASVAWDGDTLEYGPGVERGEAEELAGRDDLEEMWKTYYGAIFNPARIKLKAMQAEMPKKHWPTMPETETITELLRQAPERVKAMETHRPASPDLGPIEELGWEQLASACRSCDACERCEAPGVGEAVFGEGNRRADVVLVGEQPGDREDRVGRPFVGPAGGVLDEALQAAGLARDEIYLTNAVKHFGFTERGGKRIHDSPDAYITEMCKPWLEAELSRIQPRVVVALGRTAARVLSGRHVAISRERGEFLRGGKYAAALLPTFHPAAIVRAPDGDATHRRFEALVEDLTAARDRVDRDSSAS